MISLLCYTNYMSAPHVLLELRTGRDSEHTPESAVQLFSALPELHNEWWWHLLGTNEYLSVEIIAENQLIYFQIYTPVRLKEYIRSTVAASYPAVMVTEITRDAVLELDNPTTYSQEQSSFISLGDISLRRAEYLPIKTYQDFKDIDPIAPLLATLSKIDPLDRVIVQFVLNQDGEGWKRKGLSLIENKSGGEMLTEVVAGKHPKKALIEKKLKPASLKVGIRMAVSAHTNERSQLLLETVASAFGTVTESEGNSLGLSKVYFFKENYLQMMQRRSFWRTQNMHLSIDELATVLHLPTTELQSIQNISWGKNLIGEPPENLPIVTKEMPREDKKEVNPFAKTIFKNQETVYGLKRADRRRHMYVIGKTGTGKSTLLANMAVNDLKNDEGMCVIDPHGDLVEHLLDYIPSRRINDVIYFDPADPERTVQLNLFEGENVAHRELIASGIVSVFQKLYGYSWGPRLEYILRNALLTLLKSKTARLSDILDMLTNRKFRDSLVEELDDPILRNFWLYEFNRMQDRQRQEAIAPILNKVGQFVSSPLVRDVVNARKSSFSIEDAMDQGKIVLVNLSQGRLGEDNATLLGAMLITKIQLAAMSRVHIPEEQRRDFYLYVDEFQNFATESFNKILSEARKYRLNLILANQYIAQIPEEVQKAIFGNCGSVVSFVMGAEDAAAFEREYGELYTKEDLVSLSRHQIINRLSIDNVISRPFPAFTLGPAKSFNANREKVIKVSRERWARKKGTLEISTLIPDEVEEPKPWPKKTKSADKPQEVAPTQPNEVKNVDPKPQPQQQESQSQQDTQKSEQSSQPKKKNFQKWKKRY